MIDIITFVTKELEKLNFLLVKLPDALEKGLDRGAFMLRDSRNSEIAKTYRRESKIPKTKSGKPKWKLSGDLQRGQQVKSLPGERQLTMEGPAGEPITNYPGGYSQKLATLPVSKDGIARANPYAKNAVKAVEAKLDRAIELEIRNALGLDTMNF